MSALQYWPQAVVIGASIVSWLHAMEHYGKPKKPKKPDRYGIADVLITPLLSFTILYYGGFFAAIGWAP